MSANLLSLLSPLGGLVDDLTRFLSEKRVALRLARPSLYQDLEKLRCELNSLGSQLGWSDERGTFNRIVPPGARVLLKPNWVLHENQGPWSFDAVITHPSLVQGVVAELLQTDAAEIWVGDAPVQGCDFPGLMERTGLGTWAETLELREPRFRGVHDFRRTVSIFRSGVRYATEDRVAIDQYVLFDLGQDSLLEPISSSEPRFRVTCYDPKFLASTHSLGRHQYLITKRVLESDVIVNLPKLKMHRKAGITNALKNLVGINGNKEYLPHHRVGGSDEAGDCYPGISRLKRTAEKLLDFKNSSSSVLRSRVVKGILKPISAFLKIAGDETGLEGSWSGNDTVWRMALDLNRILIYGCPDGTMADKPQRLVLHLSDGIVAGQGCGPLAPEPFELGVLTAGLNPAAMDWAGALMLNLDPEKISLLAGAFRDWRWPLVNFTPAQIQMLADGCEENISIAIERLSLSIPTSIPPGWSSVVRPARKRMTA